MYPRRRHRRRFRSFLARMPLFVTGLLLASAALLLTQEAMAAAGPATSQGVMQLAGLFAIGSVITILTGSVMQLAGRSSVRQAGFAGMGVGVSLFMMASVFTGSI